MFGTWVAAAPRTWTTVEGMETVPPMVATRTQKHTLTWYAPPALFFSFSNKGTSVIVTVLMSKERVCCQVLNVLDVFQGIQLNSMKGDLLSVDYESSEEEEVEEEEEERVVVNETSKTR